MNWINGPEREKNMATQGKKNKKGVEQWLELGLRMVNIIIINHIRSSFTQTFP